MTFGVLIISISKIMVQKTIEDTDMFLVIRDIFSKLGWTLPLKNKKAQTIKDSSENILISSKRKPNLIESDRGKEFYNKIFQDFLNRNNIKTYSRKSSFGVVLQNDLIVLLEIYLKRSFLNKVMQNWLIFYLQKRNNIIIEYIH